MNILVYPFENTGKKVYSWISAGMTDTVISDLNNIQDIHVVSDLDRKRALQEIELGQTGIFNEKTIAKVGKLTGADLIFTGSYTVIGEKIRVTAKLIRVSTGVIDKSVKIDGVLKDIFDVQDKVVLSLMSRTEKIRIPDIKPVELNESEKRVIVKKYRPALDAYKWYAKGMEVRDLDPEKGLSYFTRAYKIDPEYVDALIKIGHTTGRVFNRYEEALHHLALAEKLMKRKGKEKSAKYAYLKMNIGIVHGANNQWSAAQKNYLESKRIYEDLSLLNSDGYTALLTNIGGSYLETGRSDTALEYFLESKKIQDGGGLTISNQYSALLNNIGNLYMQKGELDRALGYYTESKEIKDKLGLSGSPQYSINLNNIGVVHFNRREIDKAMYYYKKAKDIRDRLKLQNTREYASLMMDMGIIYSMKKDYQPALQHYEQSRTIMNSLRLQKTKSYSLLLMNLGATYKSQGKLDRAMEYLSRSLDLKEELGLTNTTGYGHALLNIGAVYLKRGEKKRAGGFFRKAYNAYQRAGYNGRMKSVALKFARKYE